MKLPIKKKYFDQIVSGDKLIEFRDAHITFVCEETGDIIVKDVVDVFLKPVSWAIQRTKGCLKERLFDDDTVICFCFNEEGQE